MYLGSHVRQSFVFLSQVRQFVGKQLVQLPLTLTVPEGQLSTHFPVESKLQPGVQVVQTVSLRQTSQLVAQGEHFTFS
jgi:hypothetical protein